MVPLDLISPTEDVVQNSGGPLAVWRDALIDLTARNPLASLSAKGTGGCVLPGMTPETLMASLSGRRSLLIAPNTHGLNAFETPSRARRTLLHVSADEFHGWEGLRRRASLVTQERAANLLFAALGVLDWPGPQSTDVAYRSPLLLVPVILERVAGIDLLRLRRFDDEVVFNPALCAAWERAGITLELPSRTEGELIEPSAVIRSVRAAVQDRSGWSVAPECRVGLFAPQNFAMARDLDALAPNARERPLAAALLGDSDALQRLPAVTVPAPHDLDAAPERLHCVLDADPTQRRAILAARRGQSLVLHAPPGTGASQTIANLIADGIGVGKRVLFVSRKTASLDAVAGHLRDRGLASFYLEAHGEHASKKRILDRLQAALEARAPERMPSDADRQELDRLTGQLNQTVAALHAPRPPLGISVYEANGVIAASNAAPDLPFVFPDADAVTADAYRILEDHAARLAEQHDLLGELTTHPWLSIRADAFSVDLSREIRSSLTGSLDALNGLMNDASILARGWHLDVPQSVHETDELVALVAAAQETPHPPPAWLSMSTEEREGLRIEADTLRAQQAIRRAAYDSLREGYDEGLFSLPLSDLEHRLGERHEATLQPVFGNDWREKITRAEGGIDEILADVEGRIADVRQSVAPIAEALDSLPPDTISNIADLLSAAQSASGTVSPDVLDQSKTSFAVLGESLRALGGFLEMPRLPFTDQPLPHARLPDLAAWIAALRASVLDYGDAYLDYGDAYRTAVDARREDAGEPTSEQLADDIATAAAWQTAHQAESEMQPIRQDRFGAYAQGEATDWEQIREALAWTDRLCALFPDARVPDDLAAFVCEATPESLSDLTVQWTRVRLGRESLRLALAPLYDLFPPERLSVQGHALEALRHESVAAWLTTRLERLPDLERWLDFQTLRRDCERLGLASFFDAAAHRRIAPDAFVPAFRKRFYRLWRDAVLEREPVLKSFHGEEHNARIARFAELDAQRGNQAAEEVAALAQARRPTALFGMGEGALLRAQLHRRNSLPIRTLLAQIPNLLACLKPCLLMSPTSIGQFLDPERIEFDLVIFDEASQLTMHDSIGALLRARQGIIVGDGHQLSPDAGALAAGDTGTGEDFAPAPKSLFDAADDFASNDSPHFARHALTWHTQSRDESLIAVSRRQFYPDLNTFPAAREERAVVFERVSSSGAGEDNPIEAAHVAALVSQWVRREPKQSLGVITFSAAQQEAVAQAVARRVRAKPDLEALLDEAGPEGFFIKTVEHAQGDVRDVIFLSVGYRLGPDVLAAPRLGALGQDSGERLVNVAITRARQTCVVVSSLLPGEIASERRGPRLLRAYLDYAQSGDSMTDAPPALSPFEGAIETALTARGHRVHRHIGISKNRVTLAVVDPSDPGHYLLGIECDGNAYSAIPTASLRDRLRRERLMERGWRLTRIWSSDWVRNPAAEIARIEAMLVPQQISLTEPPPSAASLPPGLTFYDRSAFTLAGGFAALEDEATREEFLCSVVGLEGPLSIDTAAQRLARAAVLAHADDRIHAILEDTVDAMVEKNILEQRDAFLWTRGGRPPARVPRAGEPPRPVEQIALEEIGEVALAALRAAFGMRRAALVLDTGRLLGYPDANANVRERINEALSLLERENRVVTQGGQIRAAKG